VRQSRAGAARALPAGARTAEDARDRAPALRDVREEHLCLADAHAREQDREEHLQHVLEAHAAVPHLAAAVPERERVELELDALARAEERAGPERVARRAPVRLGEHRVVDGGDARLQAVRGDGAQREHTLARDLVCGGKELRALFVKACSRWCLWKCSGLCMRRNRAANAAAITLQGCIVACARRCSYHS
jgi:hypothetical protein